MIGDVLISSIICNNLRKAYPDAQIDYLVNENTVDILQGNPHISSLIIFEQKHQKSFIELLKFAFQIRKTKYDLVIDSYSKLQSWIITLFCGAPKKISYRKFGRTFLYTNNVPLAEYPSSNLGLAIERRLSLLSPLNLTTKLEPYPKLFVSNEELTFAEDIFKKNKVDSNRKTIMISLLGSSASKTYPLDYMTTVINTINEHFNVNILFNYFPSQIKEAEQVLKSCTPSTQNKIYFNLLGKNLREYIAIMNKCDLIIGNDGGAINIAKALGKPSFIIFSPWIEKKIWATFEDGINHVSVHLNDYFPEDFNNVSEKELKEKTILLYQKFTPQLITDKLITFLKGFL